MIPNWISGKKGTGLGKCCYALRHSDVFSSEMSSQGIVPCISSLTNISNVLFWYKTTIQYNKTLKTIKLTHAS